MFFFLYEIILFFFFYVYIIWNCPLTNLIIRACLNYISCYTLSQIIYLHDTPNEHNISIYIYRIYRKIIYRLISCWWSRIQIMQHIYTYNGISALLGQDYQITVYYYHHYYYYINIVYCCIPLAVVSLHRVHIYEHFSHLFECYLIQKIANVEFLSMPTWEGSFDGVWPLKWSNIYFFNWT